MAIGGISFLKFVKSDFLDKSIAVNGSADGAWKGKFDLQPVKVF